MTKHFLEMTTEEREYALNCAETFLKWTREDIKNVTKSFFKIGFRLYEARAYKYYEALGYPDIETLAEEEFGFKRSSTYGFIQVYERVCIQHGHNTMDKRYVDYEYSKLLELCKVKLAVHDILYYIKPTDSVREIHQYVKFWNEYTNKHSTTPKITLQEWKAQQAQISPALPAPTAPIEGQLSIEDTVLDEPQPNTNVNNVAPLAEQPTETVQTFGLPTCAEPKQTETVAKPKASKPTYNFHSRDGVRTFLKDYESWKKYAQSWGSPFFKATYGYIFKNGSYIMACERSMFEGAKFDEKMTVIEPTYFLSTKYGFTEISKNQFEQYCAEHKDKL